MASTEKNKPSGSVSVKKSAKERRDAQRRSQQRQQQIILTVVALTVLVGVLLTLFVSTRPAEAFIPENTLSRYQEFQDKKLYGITTEGYPYLGAENAPVVLEEVASFSCPACKAYHDGTVTGLLDLAKDGRLKLVYIPITNFGSAFVPQNATQGALCAAQQGKFFEFHDVLFDWQTRYAAGMNDTNRLNGAAAALGLDTGKFSACLGSADVKNQITTFEDRTRARGVSATPTIYLDGQQISPTGPGIVGPSNLSELRGYIEDQAAQKQPK